MRNKIKDFFRLPNETLRPNEAASLRADRTAYDIIEKSGLFDKDYYFAEYPDVAVANVDPLQHYLEHGANELRNPSRIFSTEFYLDRYNDVSESGVNPLVHYVTTGQREGRSTSTMQLISESGLFDPSYYLLNNEDVGAAGLSPLQHYIEHGWSEYRNPCASFDLIWYSQNYLESDWSVNPLLHYLNEGKDKGYLTRPQTPISFAPSTTYKSEAPKPRRICLFAGYDSDGLIDPVVIEYIRDLSHHADVYYLADCQMPSSELAKLDGLVKGAWSERHGRYDFGSWSALAKKLVGWKIIEGYDELILANDSCYLMRSLSSVFADMDARNCDWWGVQATKGMISTFSTQALPEEISLDAIKQEWLSRFEEQPLYDFHVGSYFLVFRKPVLFDPGLRSLLNKVTAEPTKLHIIRKYEIGLTRFLISKGYNFETFVRTVYPHQPIYSETCFDLIRNGFPFLKKFHLIENHYRIPSLYNWPERIRHAGIKKDLAPYSENLRRTADAYKLYQNQDIECFNLNRPLSGKQLRAADSATPKYDDWWVLPVCGYSHLFNDNIRALFEHVKNDPTIKKIVLTRSKPVHVDGVNVVVAPLHSREGQFYLLRARHIFLKHTVRSNIGVELSPKLHCFHNLWHGIPLKRIGYASLDFQDRLEYVANGNKLLTSVIAASKVDQNAMATAYWPLTINDIWLTGLPRHDLILKPEDQLPADLRGQLARLRASLNGRKLILFAPTFRLAQGDGYYNFTQEERDALAELLEKNGYIMGVREHMADNARQYTSQLTGPNFVAVPETLYPCVEILLREAAIVATDYSSVFIDFLLTGRPVISFAYDFDHYINTERGLFYDLEWSFPGRIAKDFPNFLSAISEAMNGLTDAGQAAYLQRRRLFIDHYDDGNSARVVKRVTALQKGDVTIFDTQAVRPGDTPQRALLWVYDANLTLNARYRMLDLAAAMEKAGWSNIIVTANQLNADIMLRAHTAIFCDVSGTDQVMDFAEGFRRGGRSVIYDVSTPLFDRSLLNFAELYRNNPATRATLRLQSDLNRRMMQTANLVTVPTRALARLVERLGVETVCIPDPLAANAFTHYSEVDVRKDTGQLEVVKVCYIADPETSSSAFAKINKLAQAILSDRNDVEFHFFGSVNDEIHDIADKQWIWHPYLNRDRLHALLEEMDIHLAPLDVDAFHQCQSERRLVEAGLHAIPTIASPTEAYQTFIRDGLNGLLADTPQEWRDALLKLVSDPSERQRMGTAAKLDTNGYSASRIAGHYITEVLSEEMADER